METLQVCMFGRFSLETQGSRIDDLGNRSQKPWLLLAYLLYHRSRVVPQEELLRLCWDSEEIKGDPANALRVVLHRARTMLDKLGLIPGRELILRSRDGFQWNERLPVHMDVEEFTVLYQAGKAAEAPEERCACFERAIELYHGRFLLRNAEEDWVQCMAAHFQAMFLEMALETLDILAAAGQIRQVETLCRSVLAVEPYEEKIYRRLMQALLEQGRSGQAARLYEQLRAALLAEFDRPPEDETSRMYFKAIRLLRPAAVPLNVYRPDEEHGGDTRGVRVCDFNFYRMFYYSIEQMVVRCGLKVYNVLLTLEPQQNKTLSERSRERLMDSLMEQMQEQLNRGDAISRCADHQITGMVQADEYEQACLICERIVERFYREHPNAPVSLGYGAWRVGGEDDI